MFADTCVELCMSEREFIHTLDSIEWDRNVGQINAVQVLMWRTSVHQVEKPV